MTTTQLKCKDNSKSIVSEELKNELDIQLMLLNGKDHLILDKEYEVLDMEVLDFVQPLECYFLIMNESGKKFWYSSKRFYTK